MLSYRDRRIFLELYHHPPEAMTPMTSPNQSSNANAGSVECNRPPAFDSHYHHDRLCIQQKRPCSSTLDEVCRDLQPNAQHRVTIVGAVANFCDPGSYPTSDDVAKLNSQGVRVTIGIHPKKSRVSDADFRKFREAVRIPGVIGIGEVGLDRSGIKRDDAQERDLRSALAHLKPAHTLVLHCREEFGRDPNELYQQLLLILQLAKVPSEQKMHVHCYNGDVATLEKWVVQFPKTWFGFTPLAKSFDDKQRAALNFISDRFLLLETDAPHFAYPGFGLSAPSTIGRTAEIVARIRGCTVEKLLECTRENAQEVYPQ